MRSINSDPQATFVKTYLVAAAISKEEKKKSSPYSRLDK
jgi:hypothetical protein